jgi:adenylate kinase
MARSQPNVIVTGTPGVGKTTHCEILAQNTGLKHLLINDIVKERGCHDGYDEEFKSWLVDEDRVRTVILCSQARADVLAVGFYRR